MPTEIHIKHPLQSNGSHQLSRLVKAISPTHFRLDERSAQDLISAAYQYAQMLRYHGPDSPAGDNWSCFWEIENLTYMAILAAMDTDQIRKDYEKIDLEFGLALEGQTGKKNKKSNSEIEGQYFRRLLRVTRDTARRIERHYQTLRDDISLKAELLRLIKRDNDIRYDPDDIEGALQQLIAWHKAWDDNLDFKAYRAFFHEDHRWGVRNLDEYHCILPDESLTDRDEIRGLFLRFFNILVAIKARAQQLFDAESARLALPEDQEPRPLAPHIALFIAFLNLFRHAQDSLNDIPGRHLDFYYDQVLCLHRRPADPDHAFLIFTLAKEFNDELIEKDTTLLAGKDKFKTLEQWKVTRAQVAEIRNTCIAPDFINASTISEKGAPPKSAFRAFGDDNAAPEGALGFAIASPQLYLLEGQRTIDINLSLEGKIEDANEFPSIVNVEYSTGDGFHTLPKLSIDESGKANGFVLRPLLSPFLPLQRIEPARRIANDVISDLCVRVSPITDPSDFGVAYIHFRGANVSATKFLQDEIFYPALSGIYSINRYIREADAAAQNDPTKALDDKFRAQLLFYRAYYHWSLASTFLPAYDATEDNEDSKIPDLANWQPGDAFVSLTRGDLYSAILDDLDEAVDLLENTEGKDTDSKTSINYYSVQAFLSRVYLHMQKWADCENACDEVLGNPDFSLNGPEYDDTTAFRSDDYDERLKKTFEDINTSSEVIWALETSQGGLGESLFSYLGYNDSFERKSRKRFFGESQLLDDLYKKTWSSLSQSQHRPSPDHTVFTPSGWTPTQWLNYQDKYYEAWDHQHYDFRDTHFFAFDEPLGMPDTPERSDDKTYSNKYFQKGQTQVVMLRLAEVYLNKAACLMLKSSPNKTEARKLVNQLRYRAGALPYLVATPGNGPSTSIKIKVPDKNDPDTIVELNATFDNFYSLPISDFNISIIEEERMRELCFEGDRKDFVRAAQKTNLVKLRDILDTRGDKIWSAPELYFNGALPVDQNQNPNPEQGRITSSDRSSTLNLNVTLKEDAPPILPDNNLSQKGIANSPIIRVTFEENDKSDKGQGSKFYNFLKKQRVTLIMVNVDVRGIQKNLVLQNDFGVFDGTERFFPFGPVPENTARFFLGCEEAFNKEISSATVTFDWVEEEGIANGTKTYNTVYAKYGAVPNPKAKIDLLKNAAFGVDLGAARNMFTQGNAKMTPNYQFSVLDFDRVGFAEEVVKYAPSQKRGFLRFTLQGDFGHKAYTAKLLEEAVKGEDANFPSEPYTPSTNGVSLNYISEQVMQKAFDKFFHVLPFSEGLHEADIFQDEEPISLVYPYTSPAGEPEAAGYYPGNLFLGLENHQAGDNLSILIQIAEGSERDPENLPPKVHWMYLVANEWQPIPIQKILRDTTRGLTRSGLLQLAIPNDISSIGNTMLNPELLWLRATVVETSTATMGALPDLLNIRAQAIEAVFAPTERSDLSRLDKPLDAFTISKLEISRSAVKKVEQPYASFGGRRPETDRAEYHRRVSERLRHKDRAVTVWDYEHLLLEQYGQVALVKGIPHTRYEASGEYVVPSELAPGFVSVAVVPDLLRRPNMVREEPRFSRGDLYEMRDFLLPKTNLFLQPIPADPADSSDEEDHFLQVVNPQYEPVHIALSVWLRRGADQNLAKYQINEALRNYLAPWLYDPAQGPKFGRDIRLSKLVQLVEEVEAVDVVKWLKVFKVVLPKGKEYPVAENEAGLLVIDQKPLESSNAPNVTIDDNWKDYEVEGTVIKPSTARSILTTAKEHQILIIGGIGGDKKLLPSGKPDETAPPAEIPSVAPRKVSAPPAPAASKKEVSAPPEIEKSPRKAKAVASKSKASNSKH